MRKEIFTFRWKEERIRGRIVRKRVPTATFASYGCFQGEGGGLAQRLNEIWGVVSKGAIGKTDFVTIGQGHTYPAAPGGFKSYQ